jgi:hypothetical protein
MTWINGAERGLAVGELTRMTKGEKRNYDTRHLALRYQIASEKYGNV